MPEGNANVEIAQHLNEHDHGTGDAESGTHSRRRVEIVEILEAFLLAIVALSTALSGYQAARWDGESAKAYATSSRLRVEAQSAQLSSNQYLLYNSGNLDSWLQATTSGQPALAKLLVHRFTPEYAVAFRAWLRTHPLTNPKAPPGPRYMPQYTDKLAEHAGQLNEEATKEFELGVTSRERGENYVRVTVILAMVLFLIAIGQRFHLRRVRVTINTLAGAFLVYCVWLLITYPHA